MIGAAIVATTYPSAGALLGTSGSAALIRNINESLGSTTFFGSVRDTYADIRNAFVENIVAPIKAVGNILQNTVTALVNPDKIRPLVTEEDFQFVPPSMHLPILMFAPVTTLLKQGRISGFGYEYADLPKEDVYGRLIDNGTCYDVVSAIQPDGMVYLEWNWKSDDPLLSENELDAIESTRQYIEHHMLANTRIDITAYPDERG